VAALDVGFKACEKGQVLKLRYSFAECTGKEEEEGG
jgi:hypothetical protein